VLFILFSYLSCCFLIFALIWCAVWKFQSVHLVQLILSSPCAIFGRIPYTLSCWFYFRYLSPYCNFIWFILCSLSLLISESICVLSSHIFPKCHQIIVVLCLAYLFLDFGLNICFESAVFLILWCFLFLAWVHICV